MARQSFRIGVLGTLVLLGMGVATMFSQAEGPPTPAIRKQAEQQMTNGNWNDAYLLLRKLCLHPDTDPKLVGSDLDHAQQCLNQLGRVQELDELLAETVKVHQKNWRLLSVAANVILNTDHNGFQIAGKFERGQHRGGGEAKNAWERDRVQALQWMVKAIPLANADDDKQEVANFYNALAGQLLYNRGYTETWRLQLLTDVNTLPDYDDGFFYGREYQGAPVDAEGKPIYHHAAKSWEAAETDGQRWQWALDQVVENQPANRDGVRWQRAQFYQSQFDVTTLANFGWGRHFFGLPAEDDETKKNESGTYELHTLKENETIAKLASGVKRFELPDEFNFLRIYRELADDEQSGQRHAALRALAEAFENRRQYPTAAELWQRVIALESPVPNLANAIKSFFQKYDPNEPDAIRRLRQITGNWGRFEPARVQPAGQGATVDFRFRNGKKVHFEAFAIHETKLLDDLKAYLKSDPRQLDWEKLEINNIGWRLVERNEKKYIGDRVAAWDLELQPRDQHFDRRTTVTTPLQKAGAYLVTAQIEGGNASRIVLWVADTAIVHKRLAERDYYFVADAATGQPVAGANVEFFGYQQLPVKDNQYRVTTANFAEQADKTGQVFPDPRDLKPNFQWIAVARTKGGRFASLGFTNVWYERHADPDYNAIKIFSITDRPVYRPKQKVNFKFWVRQAKYDVDDSPQFTHASVPFEIHDPKGEKVFSGVLQTDEFAGVVGEWEIPAGATLGQYAIQVHVQHRNQVVAHGGGSFRIEEYKKPEFEVKIDAPAEPVMLGEKVTAKINAKYYFGSPVTKATVKYKITRVDHSEGWFPLAAWDWCYGPGYWWFGYDCVWYPTWRDWVGCKRARPFWFHFNNHQPPEVVAENELPIGPDGTLDLEIDTLIAKELHGDTDHQYSITAEVRDESRRTIVGSGNVLVARKPFKVFTWVDRGYYRTGDTIRANFLAQTLDRKPVVGKGELTLLKITYDKKRQPVETPVQNWKLDTNEAGQAEQQIKATAAGQYRLSYHVTDSAGHKIEGGYLFTVGGAGFDGRDYRFNHVELIPEKREYAPGEKLRLQINTDHADSTVLLFIRPANGLYLPPKVLRLKGKSTVEEIDIVKKDMPNIFIEAVTVTGAAVHSETKEIVVPPEKRVLNVEVLPSEKEYLPGQQAKVKIRLTDSTGENYVGSTVVAIYDKAVEYISGGSNVPDIKEFFWKWRRQHHPSHMTSLQKFSDVIYKSNEVGMGDLGMFGGTVVDDDSEMEEEDNKERPERLSANMMGGGFGGGGMGGGGMAPSRMMMLADGVAPTTAALGMNFRGDAGVAFEKSVADAADPSAVPVEPSVRSNFADIALWAGALTTNQDGTAEVSLKMPENLTNWKIKVWGMGHGTRVGSGEAEVVTRKNIIVRLQAPRFFVQKDEVVLSANVHNYLKTEKVVDVVIELGDQPPADGNEPSPGAVAVRQPLKLLADAAQRITIPAGGEQRVDWRVKVVDEGTAVVRMKALTDVESDAMEMSFPCYVHGLLKQEAWAGTVRPDKNSSKLTIRIPEERRPEQSVLEIRYSPSLAAAMVDALPYLAEYPYGCTEQTLNRFLPSVVTQKVLREMELDLVAIRDKRANLNAQEIGDDRSRAKQWQRFDRNPVFDEAELNRMVKEGLTALTNMQCSDGGWGWFSGYGEHSWPHTTAVVVHGLQIAQQNDQPLVPGVLERGVDWLKRYQAEQVQLLHNYERWKKDQKLRISKKATADDLDAFVFMILVDAGSSHAEMRDFLYRDRNHLAVHSKAMFGLALHKLKENEKLAMLLQNIGQFLVQDEENETAYLKLPENNYWWTWYGSEIEANAYYLKLLAKTDPQGAAAPRLVKYLLNNRKHATYWNSTRDTATCVEAFADFLRGSGETKPEMVVEVWLDGEKRQESQITAQNLFTFNNKFVLSGVDVTSGSHVVEIRRRGKGSVYFNAYLTNFTLEDHITKAGLEVKVDRKFYKLIPAEKKTAVAGSRGQALEQKVEKYERQPLANLASVKSGDLLEVELEIESKNDYEYILFEDLKAAGCEAVDVRSGYIGGTNYGWSFGGGREAAQPGSGETAHGLHAYMEVRDNRVSFFVRQLARGKHSVAYRLRAETPGTFSALPAQASAMYAPELKANADEMKLRIEE